MLDSFIRSIAENLSILLPGVPLSWDTLVRLVTAMILCLSVITILGIGSLLRRMR